MRKLLTIVSVMACFVGVAAQAHTPRKGPHGGEVQTHNGQVFEAVLASGKLEVYISGDSNQQTSVQSAHALIVLVDEHQLRKIALQQTRTGFFEGSADFTLPAKGRVWVVFAWRKQDDSVEQTIFEPPLEL